MRVRSAAISALVVLLAGSGAADAARTVKAPPPLCNLVVGSPDGQPNALDSDSLLSKAPLPYGSLPVHDSALLIKSADVANNATTVSVVFRMAQLVDSSPAPGRFYQFSWVWASSGVNSQIWARVGGLQGDGASKGATLVVDRKKNEIRIHQSIDLMSGHPLFTKGDRMTQLLALTDLASPQEGLALTQGLYGHRATSTKTYPLFAPSCIRIGA